MTTAPLEKLIDYGVDYDDVLDRFDGNEDLFERLSLKYLENDRVVNLVAALETQNLETAYNEAHTLKGVAGNLSFTDIYREAASITEALRNSEMDTARAHLPALIKADELIRSGLLKLQNGQL